MESLRPSLIVGALTLFVGWILHVVGISTKYWMDGSIMSIGGSFNATTGKFEPTIVMKDYHAGLWKECIGGDNCTKIDDLNENSSDFSTVCAFVVLGALLGAIGLLIVVFMLVWKSKGKALHMAVLVLFLLLLLAADGCIMIGVIVYAIKIYGDVTILDDLHLGYSFPLCIVGGLGVALGGVLGFAGGRTK